MTTKRPGTKYIVWIFGEHYEHRTLPAAIRRARKAQGYCNGEHLQIIDAATGNQVSF
ncbi:MAG: hypothetical protein WC551_08775 [Patescibacteria group bacterium]